VLLGFLDQTSPSPFQIAQNLPNTLDNKPNLNMKTTIILISLLAATATTTVASNSPSNNAKQNGAAAELLIPQNSTAADIN